MEHKVCIYFLIDQMDSKDVLYPGPKFHHRLEIHLKSCLAKFPNIALQRLFSKPK